MKFLEKKNKVEIAKKKKEMEQFSKQANDKAKEMTKIKEKKSKESIKENVSKKTDQTENAKKKKESQILKKKETTKAAAVEDMDGSDEGLEEEGDVFDMDDFDTDSSDSDEESGLHKPPEKLEVSCRHTSIYKYYAYYVTFSEHNHKNQILCTLSFIVYSS